MNFFNGLILLVLGTSVLLVSCKKEGCTDSLATNYNKKANHDDGTCKYDVLVPPPGVTTVIDENITVATTVAAGTVEVCGNITVSAGLTIEPGVTFLMCAGARLNITETGYISAVGTAANQIVFKGVVGSSGYWGGIGIYSNNPNNQFDYVTVDGAGDYWVFENANVYLSNLAKLSIKNSTITNSNECGLYMGNSASFSSFSNNTFSNNNTVGLNVSLFQVGAIDAGSNYNVGNGENFIRVRGGTLGSNATWQPTTTPYLLTGDMEVQAGLTLLPGVNLLMESGAGIDVKESGYLTATGSATAPIIIKGRYNSAGYWDGIYFRSNNPNNKLNYVNLEYGGEGWFLDYSTVWVGGRLEMNNSSISNSNSWAMVVGGSGSVYCSGTSQTDAAGVQTVNTISGNGAGADADCLGGGCTVLFE